MVSKNFSILWAVVAAVVCQLGFQNCGGFATMSTESVAAGGLSSSGGEVIVPLVPGTDASGATPPWSAINAWEPPINPAATPGTFVTGRFTCDSYGMAREMSYRVLLPADVQLAKLRYPLVVALASSGIDVMTDNAGFEADVNSIWNITSTRQKFPAIILAPQVFDSDNWGSSFAAPSGAGLCGMQLVHSLLTSYPIDTKRVYISGGWMGGSGTWDWLSRQPDFFAAGIPQGGGVADSAFAPALLNTPIWAFYGKYKDGGGHEETVTSLVAAIQNLGGKQIKFTENPLGDPAGMYGPWNINPQRPGVLEWLFSQRHP